MMMLQIHDILKKEWRFSVISTFETSFIIILSPPEPAFSLV